MPRHATHSSNAARSNSPNWQRQNHGRTAALRHPLHASLTTPHRHWLDHTWDAGGGLPAIAVPLAKDVDGSLGFGEGRVAERLIFPSAVRERLLQVDRVTCAAEQHVEQRTTLASCGGLLRLMAAHSGCAAAPLRAQWEAAVRP